MTCNINKARNIALLTLSLCLAPSVAQAEDVYWTTKDLLKDFFKTSERVTYVKLETARQRAQVEKILGYAPKKPSYVVFVAKTSDRIDGYAVIDEEMGQHQPITFGVKISATGQVERLEIMVYREGYGDEIREKRFRRQFEGKTKQDDIRFGDDVVAVTGATISSQAMAIGVRRAVALVAVAEQQLVANASPAGPGMASAAN
jgi:electron transport complex protein RnfG